MQKDGIEKAPQSKSSDILKLAPAIIDDD